MCCHDLRLRIYLIAFVPIMQSMVAARGVFRPAVCKAASDRRGDSDWRSPIPDRSPRVSPGVPQPPAYPPDCYFYGGKLRQAANDRGGNSRLQSPIPDRSPRAPQGVPQQLIHPKDEFHEISGRESVPKRDFEQMDDTQLNMERTKIRRELAWHETAMMGCQQDLDTIDAVETDHDQFMMQQRFNAEQEESREQRVMAVRATLGRCLSEDCCYLEYSKDIGKFDGCCCERCLKQDRKKCRHGKKCEHIHYRTLLFVPPDER